MSMESWQSHVESRGNPALEGAWGDIPWEFYEYNQEVPATLPIRTAMCVPVRSLDPYNPEVMLTINMDRGGLEIPGGHLDVLRNGEKESSRRAAARETSEETGLHVEPWPLIPFGYIVAKDNASISYMQFFAMYNPNHPGSITDPRAEGAGTFAVDALRRMTENGKMKPTELQLVYSGIRAIFRRHSISDEHLTMS